MVLSRLPGLPVAGKAFQILLLLPSKPHSSRLLSLSGFLDAALQMSILLYNIC
jgi:hypothetical protein